MRTRTYFRVIRCGRNNTFNTNNHGKFKLRQLSPEKALQLWEEGFTYFALTDAGAKKYFGGLKSAAIVLMINESRSCEDARALASTKLQATTVQRALNERLTRT